MWTVESRGRYDRSKLRYPGDLTDEEWTLARSEISLAKRADHVARTCPVVPGPGSA